MPKPRKKPAKKKAGKKKAVKPTGKSGKKVSASKHFKRQAPVKAVKPKLKAAKASKLPRKFPAGYPLYRVVNGKEEMLVPFIWRMKKYRLMLSKERILANMKRFRRMQRHVIARAAELAGKMYVAEQAIDAAAEQASRLESLIKKRFLSPADNEQLRQAVEGYRHAPELYHLEKQALFNRKGQAYLRAVIAYYDAVLEHASLLLQADKLVGGFKEEGLKEEVKEKRELIRDMFAEKTMIEGNLEKLKKENDQIRNEILSLKDFLLDSRDEWA